MRKFLQIFIISLATFGFAQDGTIDYSFNPSTGPNGNVNVTAVQSDGKMIVGGDFTKLNNINCNKLGRLNIDGSFDVSFNFGTGFNNTVSAISIQSDGKIIVVGNFTSYNGVTKNRIVRLNTDGTIDSSFNIGNGANDTINSIVLQSDGKIILVGNFTSFSSTSKNRIVRLNLDGTIDSAFNIATGANNSVYSCAVQSDGKIVIGGIFTTFTGVSRKRIARLNSDGTLDATFNSTNAADGKILKIFLQPDGRIIIGGEFTSYNGVSTNYIARLNTDSTLDTSYNTGNGFDYFVKSIISQSDGKLLIGGDFYSYNGTSSSKIVRLNVDGILDSTFDSSNGFDSTVNSLSIQSNGKILVGGNFLNCNSLLRNRVASLNTDGTTDFSFNPYLQDWSGVSNGGMVYSIANQLDGKIIVGGDFYLYNTIARNNIVRLNIDGTLDTTFNIGTGTNSFIRKTALQPDGKIIIAGVFTSYNGIPRNRIARLNADGTLDLTFNSSSTGVNNAIHTFSIQPDGKIIIGGDFSNIDGVTRFYVARLNANGILDTSFNPGTGPEGNVWTTLIQPDGKIIIGGNYLTYNGSPSVRVTRLNANGSIDTTFNVGQGPDYFVYNSSLQSDGKIIIGGWFTTVDNVTKNGIARLNTDGSLDMTFNATGTGVQNSSVVYNNIIQSDGKIIIGGVFETYNGLASKKIARLNIDGALDPTFTVGIGFSGNVMGLAQQIDGKILVGGAFDYYNGNNVDCIVRLNSTSILSLDDFNNIISVKLYPNPVNDYLKFKLPNDINVSSFEVFDLIGKKIDSNILNTNVIDVNNYIDGIYFLHLKTDKGVLITKFIKN